MRIRTLFTYGSTVFAGLALIWTIIVWNEWLPRATAAQQAALALMHAPSDRVAGHRNAWGFFWLLPYEVPEEDWAAVLAEDVEALDARHDQGAADAYVSVAEARYSRRLPKMGGRSKFCAGQDSCLDAVRADPQAAEVEWQANTGLLDVGRRIGDYDHFRTPHRPSLSAPIPTIGAIRPLQMLDVARSFIAGRPDEAFERLCRDTAAWRRLKGRSDSLIFEMFNASNLRRASALYAEMRAELPRDYPMPGLCAQAFAPPQHSERQSCDVYRSEFRMFEAAMRPEFLMHGYGEDEAPSFVRKRFADLAVNQSAGAARSAERFAAICTAAALPAEQVDAVLRPGLRGCSGMEMFFDPLGCILMDIASPAYVDYWKRDRDWEGSLRLLALADKLAAAVDPAAEFEAEVALREGFEQQTRFLDGRLAIKLFQPSPVNQPWWEIRLPGSAYSAAVVPAESVAESE